MLTFEGHMTVIPALFLRLILRGSNSKGVQGLHGNRAAIQLLIVLNGSMFQVIMSVYLEKQDLDLFLYKK